MKTKYPFFLLVIIVTALIAVSCAPAATPPPAPTAVPPTQAALPTSAPAATSAPEATSTTIAAATSEPAAISTPVPQPTIASGPTLPATNVTPTPLANLPQTADDLQVISPELLKAMIEGGADIAIADAQPAEGYALGHIKGAVNLPWDMQIASPGGLPTDKLVVVYCACAPDEKPSGTDAGDVAMQLITRFGYTKIAVLDGGWVRWQQYGFPSATGQ